jgi:hypothetical protein
MATHALLLIPTAIENLDTEGFEMTLEPSGK